MEIDSWVTGVVGVPPVSRLPQSQGTTTVAAVGEPGSRAAALTPVLVAL